MRRGNQAAISLVLLLMVFVLLVQSRSRLPERPTISISDIASEVNRGLVRKLVVEGDQVEVYFYYGGGDAIGRKEPGKTLTEQLLELGVTQDRLSSEDLEIEVKEPSHFISPNLGAALIGALGGLLLGVGLTYLMLKARSKPS